MKYGIVGLGLIGGSLAKALKAAGMTVYGYARQESMREFAILSGAIDAVLTPENMQECDCLFIAITPGPACRWIEEHAHEIPQHCLVMDCCGTKQKICDIGFAMAEKYGFTFVGGHPMAGTHQWGFSASRANLFQGASFVACPPDFDDIELFDRVKSFVTPAGFGSVSVTTPADHDRLIAFTSQLAHIVSNAYVKSPTALEHRGFSAGSYQDLTRVAWLNPTMWAELFLDNEGPILNEIDIIISHLQEYRDAIADRDLPRLTQLLDDGRRLKKEVDGK